MPFSACATPVQSLTHTDHHHADRKRGQESVVKIHPNTYESVDSSSLCQPKKCSIMTVGEAASTSSVIHRFENIKIVKYLPMRAAQAPGRAAPPRAVRNISGL